MTLKVSFPHKNPAIYPIHFNTICHTAEDSSVAHLHSCIPSFAAAANALKGFLADNASPRANLQQHQQAMENACDLSDTSVYQYLPPRIDP